MPSHTLLLIAAAFGVVVLALGLLGGGRRGPKNGFRASHYAAKPLLTRWELNALAEIRADLPPGYYACPQVRLADLLVIDAGDPTRQRSAVNYVSRKSVDFAIIDGVGRVVLVVELDDKSHDRADRRQRDEMVDAVLAVCCISIRRVRPGQRVEPGRFLAGLRPAREPVLR